MFRDFYLGKHSGRKLVWHNSLASCILRAAFPKGVKELAVSLGQAVVLLLFNEGEGGALAYPDIKEGTGLKDVELMLQASADAGAPLPYAQLIRAKLQTAIAKGLGGKDWAALSEVARSEAGLDSLV